MEIAVSSSYNSYVIQNSHHTRQNQYFIHSFLNRRKLVLECDHETSGLFIVVWSFKNPMWHDGLDNFCK